MSTFRARFSLLRERSGVDSVEPSIDFFLSVMGIIVLITESEINSINRWDQ